MIRMLNIDPELVQACDTSELERLLGDLAKKPENSRQLQGSLMLTFEEFERLNHPVFLEPEVKAFLKKAHERIPHLWYFLVAEPEFNNMLIFFAVHASPEFVNVTGDKVSVQPDPGLLTILVDRMTATAKFADRMADDTKSIMSRITASLPEAIRIPLLTDIFRSGMDQV